MSASNVIASSSTSTIRHTDDVLASAVLADLGGPRNRAEPPTPDPASFLIEPADAFTWRRYHALRRDHFVDRQGLFDTTDLDEIDGDPYTIVLVARTVGRDRLSEAGRLGAVIGGVRMHPVGSTESGWWIGGRLVVAPDAPRGVGSALVRAACSRVESDGAIRFDARAQPDRESFFSALGWQRSGTVSLHGAEHVLMHWPIRTFERIAEHKAAIGRLVCDFAPGGDGWVGDDGAPVPGTDVVAVNDSILPAMVERDPWWAGWCSVLVNVNDLSAMGATPTGLLDSIGAPTESLARRVLAGMGAACRSWGIDVLGGHTQIGVHSALAVTMLGRTDRPVPGGGARAGQRLTLIADLGGGWRPGTGRQWDSTSTRNPEQLRAMQRVVADLEPAAAKDVSMAGLVGTVAMMAEASSVSVNLDIDRIPRPSGARLDQWLTCFPGFAMLVAHDDPIDADDIRLDGCPIIVAEIGRIEPGAGVTLAWPDGHREHVLHSAVTGLGPSTPDHSSTTTPQEVNHG